jgi:peptidoglycan biosynthesis protein MviN/MurJ (putative lipid II flippase)
VVRGIFDIFIDNYPSTTITRLGNHCWYSISAGFLILSRAVLSKLFQHRSVEMKAALFAAYCTLLTFVLILVYYKFYYNEAGTYKPAWLDWFG